ncbi:peroxiredoxin family protein [Aliikangiella coralliicola]|uniref:peroxiredoxin family protein n=1 Tax=Aliikangiella coralliicola TaxID=2592383 RepID=UPI00143CDB4C|nr:peroxiredoxin family protein [Aliikangiella coralliicola]
MKLLKQYLIAILMVSLTSSVALAEDDEPGEGQIAPDFTITQMDGTQFKLSDYRGKQAVYLVFWNTWCTYCMKKIPKLKAAQNDLTDEIKIISVNTGLKDSVEKSLVFQKRFEINYPLAFDHGKKVTDLYGVWGTPTEFIIDINGIIQHRDGVPDLLEPQLAHWNKLIGPNQTDTTQVATGNQDCSEEAKTC